MKPDIWEMILRPALADQQGGALFIGTPAGRNHFYEMYQNCENFPDWHNYHFTSYDNPLLPKEEIEHARATMSSYAFNQEFMASFEARESEHFKDEWVKYGKEPDEGQYFIAVDLAGFEEVGQKKAGKRDNTAIAIVKANKDGWYVHKILAFRKTLKATAETIFNCVEKYKPVAVGIEKGIAQQAVMSPLQDLMAQRRRFFNCVPLTHGNKKKTDRILWALEGRFENGRITLNKNFKWNDFLDELFQFPSKLTNDDRIDALAYIDQLVNMSYIEDTFEDEWEPLDADAGY